MSCRHTGKFFSDECLLVREVEILDEDRQRELIYKAQQGDIEARNTLIMHNMPFAIKYIAEYWTIRQAGLNHVDPEDLLQVCFFGMEHAIRKFNFEKAKGRFISYAKQWMRSYLDKYSHAYKPFKIPLSVQFLFDKGYYDKKSTAGENFARSREQTKRAIMFFKEIRPIPENFDITECRLTPLNKMIFSEALAYMKKEERNAKRREQRAKASKKKRVRKHKAKKLALV